MARGGPRPLSLSKTIIIPHDPKRDRCYLDSCLKSLEAHKDILVVEKGNISEARNRAALEASGEIFVFLDDDVIVRENCLDELLGPFKDPSIGVVGGVNVALPGISLREEISSALWSSPVAMGRSSARYTPRGGLRDADESELISCVMAVRGIAFVFAGGFPVDTIPCEENVLVNNVVKAGFRAVYNPFAVVYHRRPRVFMEYWHTIYEYGRGRGLMIRRGQGVPRMVWRPTRKWPYYIVALLGHYLSYGLGLLRGLTL